MAGWGKKEHCLSLLGCRTWVEDSDLFPLPRLGPGNHKHPWTVGSSTLLPEGHVACSAHTIAVAGLSLCSLLEKYPDPCQIRGPRGCQGPKEESYSSTAIQIHAARIFAGSLD